MSKEEQIICKKVKFATEKDAIASLEKIQATSKRAIVPVRAYLCKCKAWHLTSRPDSFELQKENTLLKKEIETLKQEIITIQTKQNREDRWKLRKEARIQQQQNKILQLEKRNTELKNLRNTLISKINVKDYLTEHVLKHPHTMQTTTQNPFETLTAIDLVNVKTAIAKNFQKRSTAEGVLIVDYSQYYKIYSDLVSYFLKNKEEYYKKHSSLKDFSSGVAINFLIDLHISKKTENEG